MAHRYLQDLYSGGDSHRHPTIKRSEKKDSEILWRRFQRVTVGGNTRQFLNLGMSDGFHVLQVEKTGLQSLVHYEGHGPIGSLTVLVPPLTRENEEEQLLVTSGNNRSTFPNTCVKIFSLSHNKYIHILRLRSQVFAVETTPKCNCFAVRIRDFIQLFDSKSFSLLLSIPCFPSTKYSHTMSLGSDWLAYPGGNRPLLPPPQPSQSPNEDVTASAGQLGQIKRD